MKTVRQGLSLALLGAGLVAVPMAPTIAAPAPAEPSIVPSIVQRLKDDAHGSVRVETEPATGRVGFARARDLLPSVEATSRTSAAAKASAYLDEYAAAFGARRAELEQGEVRSTTGGWTVEYHQSYRGVPVFGGELRAHVDAQGDLTAVNGFAVPDLDLSVTPVLSRSDAAERAVDLVRNAPVGDRDATAGAPDLEAVSTELMVYRLGSTRGVEGSPVLSWVVEVSNQDDTRETVILDARTGKPVNRWSMIAHALDRELYEAHDNGTRDDYSDDTRTLEWEEGDLFPADLTQDQENEVLGAGETYWLFKNTFGYDSYDGLGAKMLTVNNDPQIQCPNASWNGISTNYCSGVSSDDTVAHEWGHAYTEYTSELVYQWQSGAMNEAYSDIWGETVDLLNDRMDDHDQAPRAEGGCSVHSPTLITVQITAPASAAGPCRAVAASDGPTFAVDPITPEVVVGADSAASGSSTDGCSGFTNAAAIAGNWVYVDENLGPLGCSYTSQGQRAAAAGAAGIIVGSDPTYAPFDMNEDTFDLPALQVDADSGVRFKTAGTSTVRIAASTVTDDPSGRWLSGEEDPEFGGAIRDLWNPTCYGDPGKVSDEEYVCSTDDSGGVHTNSGVVNHTFALMVDGSASSNGVAVPAIGLDRAAHLFWRTQTEYLTRTSTFADLADGLEASCADLTGEDIKQLAIGTGTTGGAQVAAPLADPITASDCTAVASAIRATELREEPVQCAFGPILDPATPALCGAGFRTEVAFAEDFEDGLAGWSQDVEVVYPGATGIAWRANASAPGAHPGGVAFAPTPAAGSCQGDADDISSRNGPISPAITVPAGSSPRLSFDHYVATEVRWDGGNVKVSVGGAPYQIVPAAAYVFNAPGETLETAEKKNTNPMAGQVAFTGTNGNEPGGSWGTSIVDLSRIPGAGPGAQVRFRFDVGRDGCTGLDGWYVDDIEVTVCVAEADAVRVTHAPEPSTYGRPHRLDVAVAGRIPAGTVTATEGGRSLGTATLSAGRARIALPASLAVGSHRVTVSYPGDSRNAAASKTVTVKVAKATSRTAASAPKRVVAGRQVRVRALVTVPGSARPTGRVVVTLRGKKVASGRVDGKGRVSIRVRRLRVGRHTLVVTYPGTRSIRASKDRVSVLVTRKR
ncbi:M4 family metallopeptidase [Nocardioides sp. W7]|uniref:M4 family metallopeptidase n=1 Tax=Nocardioides sp. W7 TaxID=2931390 RepID=UPI001FD4F43A|nr:M4 family metallopeptidase [Nocardioides sp. W7]